MKKQLANTKKRETRLIVEDAGRKYSMERKIKVITDECMIDVQSIRIFRTMVRRCRG